MKDTISIQERIKINRYESNDDKVAHQQLHLLLKKKIAGAKLRQKPEKLVIACVKASPKIKWYDLTRAEGVAVDDDDDDYVDSSSDDDESENEVDGGAEAEKDIDEEAGASGGNDTEDMAIDD